MITIIGNLSAEIQFIFNGNSIISDNAVLVLSDNGKDVAWFDYENKVAWNNEKLWAFSSLNICGSADNPKDISSGKADSELLGTKYKAYLKEMIKTGVKLPKNIESMRNYMNIKALLENSISE